MWLGNEDTKVDRIINSYAPVPMRRTNEPNPYTARQPADYRRAPPYHVRGTLVVAGIPLRFIPITLPHIACMVNYWARMPDRDAVIALDKVLPDALERAGINEFCPVRPPLVMHEDEPDDGGAGRKRWITVKYFHRDGGAPSSICRRPAYPAGPVVVVTADDGGWLDSKPRTVFDFG